MNPSLRRAAAAVLGVLALASGAATVGFWSLMGEEERLAHEVSDDTANTLFFLGSLTMFILAVLAFLVVWRWPSVKRRWQQERTTWAEMRAEGRRSAPR